MAPLLERWASVELGLASVETLPTVGIDLITAGYDTPEVLRLAVSDDDEYADDLRRKAARAFSSIGVAANASCLHEIAAGRSVAQRIRDGNISAEAGLAEMVRLWRITAHSQRFHQWMILGEAVFLFRDGYGGLQPFEDLTEETIPDTICALAAEFLATNNIPRLAA